MKRAAAVLAVVLMSVFGVVSAEAKVKLKRPAVVKIAPRSGSTAGGSVVTVAGSGFTQVRSVRFGAARGTQVKVLSSHKLRVRAPRHAKGVVAITVVTRHGSSRLVTADHFTYKVPVARPAEPGAVTILAGTGTAADPTPGAALSSDLDQPGSVALDPATGDLYIADSGANTIDLLTPSGQLSIFAGIDGQSGAPIPGPATASPMDNPEGIAFDPANGDLYVADAQNDVIEQITAAGTLSIVAGDGAVLPSSTPQPAGNVELKFPYALAVDPVNGNVFFTDISEDTIDELTASGQVSVIGGPNPDGSASAHPTAATSAKFTSPFGVAVDPATGDVYAADDDYDKVFQITPAGGLSVLAGGGIGALDGTRGVKAGSIELNGPTALDFDTATGDLYIADSGNNRIIKVTAKRSASLVAGGAETYPKTGASAFGVSINNPSGVAINPATGVAFVSDTGHDLVESITPR